MESISSSSWPLPHDGQTPRQWLSERYPELRRMAAKRLRGRAIHHEIGTTSLVNEATVRVISAERHQRFTDARHLVASMACAMRSTLVDHCRRRVAKKRSASVWPLSHDPIAPDEDERLLALDAALEELATVDLLATELVKYRFYGGLRAAEAARCVGVSPRQGGRLWAFARAWLQQRLEGGEPIQ